MNSKCLIFIITLALGLSSAGQAAVTAEEAAKLKTTLTPLGAERAGNADGTIPAWEGGYTQVNPGYKPGDKRPDYFPDDEVLYTITSQNMDQYADKLTDGLKALLKKYPDFKMNVYPTRRTAAAPQRVYDNTFENATRARLVSDGFGVEGALGGTPFPIPKNAYEVMWNHILHWEGKKIRYTSDCYLATPDGKIRLSSKGDQVKMWPYYIVDSMDDFDGFISKGYYIQSSPPSKAGETIMGHDIHDYGSQKRNIWQYLVGQRRVRRAPSVSYDTPDSVTSGVGFFDEAFMQFGPWDKHEYKLIGKKEIIIPYNNNRAAAASPEEIMGPYFHNPDLMRWELHRVWVVEATLAPGKRHVVAKRKFYYDEDTWQIMLEDGWDADGNLWRFAYTYGLLAPDIPAHLGTTYWGVYNLLEGGYYVNGGSHSEGAKQFYLDPSVEAYEITPEALAEKTAR